MADRPQEPPKPATTKPDWAKTHRERKADAARAEGRKPPRRRWPWIVLLIVALGAGAFWAQSSGLIGSEEGEGAGTAPATEEPAVAAEDAAPARQVTMQLIPAEVTRIEARALRDSVRITGTLTPSRHLGIPAEVSGRVDAVMKRAGDRVEAGEVLVQIDLETLENQLEQSRATADATRAQLDFAKGELERTQSLVDRGVATSSNLDSARSNVQQLQANLTALEQQVATAEQSIGKATITAPFAGQIADRSVDPGAYVSPGTALMTLVDISSLELEGAIPVNYAPQIATGQQVEINVDGFGSKSFEGLVERVAPVASAGTRMLPIYATIENADMILRGGMFASGVLVLEEVTDAIGLPAEALRKDDQGDFVLKIVDGKAQRQAVAVARTWDRGRVVQIAKGLSPDDLVVSAALERLQPGMSVTLIGE
ncbi:efflux RND transporter periplasmic adaptor subunit [Pseudooceanicola nitratireducens]|uniref:efflux RND transporter periplasmic adaptor subunit n=1 Tax=Pseudooceanicola nitratireducens TaxID=517719 RepID=UPI003C7EBBBE